MRKNANTNKEDSLFHLFLDIKIVKNRYKECKQLLGHILLFQKSLSSLFILWQPVWRATKLSYLAHWFSNVKGKEEQNGNDERETKQHFAECVHCLLQIFSWFTSCHWNFRDTSWCCLFQFFLHVLESYNKKWRYWNLQKGQKNKSCAGQEPHVHKFDVRDLQPSWKVKI